MNLLIHLKISLAGTNYSPRDRRALLRHLSALRSIRSTRNTQVMEFTDFLLDHLQFFLDKTQMVRASECCPQFACAHITQIIARTLFQI